MTYKKERVELRSEDITQTISSRSTQPIMISRYLQKAAIEIVEWYTKWKIKINADKT